MSVASKKRRRWARRLARVQLVRRTAGLPAHPHPERVVFDAKKRSKRGAHYVSRRLVSLIGILAEMNRGELT